MDFLFRRRKADLDQGVISLSARDGEGIGIDALQRAVWPPAVAQFLVTKHSSWRGKYGRIVGVLKDQLFTSHPVDGYVTNNWVWGHVDGVSCTGPNTFLLVCRKRDSRKTKNYNFISSFASHVLHNIHSLRRDAAPGYYEGYADIVTRGFRFRRMESASEVGLLLTPVSLWLKDVHSGVAYKEFPLCNVMGISLVSGVQGGFVLCTGYPGASNDVRMHMFSVSDVSFLTTALVDRARKFLGCDITIAADPVSIDQFKTLRARCDGNLDDASSSSSHTLAQFHVRKFSERAQAHIPRLLTLTETMMVERHPQTFMVVTTRRLTSMFCVVAPINDGQLVIVQFKDGYCTRFNAPHRDGLVTCLLDCARSSGNSACFFSHHEVDKGLRTTPFFVESHVEAEMFVGKALVHAYSENNSELKVMLNDAGISVADYAGDKNVEKAAQSEGTLGDVRAHLIRMFNAIVPYSGLTVDETNPRSQARMVHAILLSVYSSMSDTLHVEMGGVPSPVSAAAAASLVSAATSAFNAATPVVVGAGGASTALVVASAHGDAAAGAYDGALVVDPVSARQSGAFGAGGGVPVSGRKPVSVPILYLLVRLFSHKVGYLSVTGALDAFKSRAVGYLWQAVRDPDAFNQLAGIEAMRCLSHPAFQIADKEHGQAFLFASMGNKKCILGTDESISGMVEVIEKHADASGGSVVALSLLHLLVLYLFSPFAATTDSSILQNLVQAVASCDRLLFRFFTHPCLEVKMIAGLLHESLIERLGSAHPLACRLLITSLREGAYLEHLARAIMSASGGAGSAGTSTAQGGDSVEALAATGGRGTNMRLIKERELSRNLIALWTLDNADARRVLHRIFPQGLINFLNPQSVVNPDARVVQVL